MRVNKANNIFFKTIFLNSILIISNNSILNTSLPSQSVVPSQDDIHEAQWECDEDDSVITNADFVDCVDAKLDGINE